MFKNALVYHIEHWEPPSLAEIESRLSAAPFVECGATQPLSAGWVAPRGDKHAALAESVAGQLVFRLCTETKAVPGSVVKTQLQAQLEAIEQQGVMFGVHFPPSPPPDTLLKAGDTIVVGSQRLEVPGILLSGPAPHEQQDAGLGAAEGSISPIRRSGCLSLGPGSQQISQSESKQAQAAGAQHIATLGQVKR